jgi:hypothetical protein
MKRVPWGVVVTLALCGLLRADRATAQNQAVEDRLAQIRQEVDQRNYGDGYKHANWLVKVLKKPAANNDVLRAYYLDSYYLMTVCAYRYGKTKNKPADIEYAALLILDLEKEYPGFYSDPWTSRFNELVCCNLDLRAAYDAQKRK